MSDFAENLLHIPAVEKNAGGWFRCLTVFNNYPAVVSVGFYALHQLYEIHQSRVFRTVHLPEPADYAALTAVGDNILGKWLFILFERIGNEYLREVE